MSYCDWTFFEDVRQGKCYKYWWKILTQDLNKVRRPVVRTPRTR